MHVFIRVYAYVFMLLYTCMQYRQLWPKYLGACQQAFLSSLLEVSRPCVPDARILAVAMFPEALDPEFLLLMATLFWLKSGLYPQG